MVCLLLTGQLPAGVQSKMKEWIAEKEEIDRRVARDFIVAVRKALAEKGVPLYRGHRDLNRLMTVSYDVATLPWSNGGYRYVLIMIDLFSKYTEAVAMPDQEASTILTALERGWFYRHGFPITLSDQGRNVDGSLIREACRKWGIRKIHSSPYHPQGDGEAERGIQTFKQTMRCLLAEKQMERTAWPDLLQQVTFIHNTQSNASTRFPPSEVMFGCRL